nr:Lrp/AsnC family transcriptional regulator [uncultured Steroidobacter sp.]
MQSEPNQINDKSAALDALDQQLLGLLRVNARTPTATLARKLGVSRGTISNRLARLEANGIITGYSVQVRAHSQPTGIRAWMSIAVEGDKTRDVVKRLLGEPAISSLHDTNGRWDLLAEVHAASIAELSEVLERIRKIKGIGNTETSIHLQTFRT